MIAPNVVLSASVPIIDVTGPAPVEYRGEVPPRKVVLPGVRQKEFPAGTYGLPCALIIGERKASTDLKRRSTTCCASSRSPSDPSRRLGRVSTPL